ncbi:MAG: RHS repeat-associated core domain-containing protein [Desulfuromonadales bacterium]|nr:RHS repeat-associated core domain-containing protein [Desulfuromonadales bacterium]
MSEQLFATQGGNFSTAFSFSYNSLDPRIGPLGRKWSHNYDIALVQNTNGSIVIREGNTRSYFNLVNGVYVAETGDYSTLVNTSTTFTLSYKNGGSKTFNNSGQMTAMTDVYGNNLAFWYDSSSGNLNSVTEATGRTSLLGYENSRLTTITDPAGNIYRFAYDGDLMKTVTRPDSSKWQYTYYDSKGFMWTKTEPTGMVTTYTYDANHRVLTGTDSAGTKSVGHATDITTVRNSSFTQDDGGQWSYTYDSVSGNVTSETDPFGSTTNYYYNADRTERAKTVTADVNTRLTTFYTYDSHGNLLTQTDPVDISSYVPAIDPATVNIASLATRTPPIITAISTTYDYANNDQVASVTDYRGGTATSTTYQYTLENGYKVTRVTDPDSHVTKTRYYLNGSIYDATDANNQVTTYSYYSNTPANQATAVVGLLYEISGPDGVKTRFTSYDKNGNSLEIKTIGTDSKELRTVQIFDSMNRLKKVTRYATGLPDNVTEYNYDNNSNRNYQKDQEGKETTILNDSKGHVTKVTDAQQHVTEYVYGSSGGTGCTSCSSGGGDKLTAVIDANKQVTSYEYDQRGRLLLETDPLQKKIRYTYYDNDLLREKIDATTPPGKVLISYYYDKLGHLTKKHYADGSEESYTYDPKGRMETASNANIGYTYTYYNNGWLKSVTDSNGKVINYDQYDGIGQKKLETIFPGTADQRQITYVYDPLNLNRIKTITSAAGTFTYGYDNFGRRNGLTYPNGTSAGNGYDDLNRLTSLTYSNGTSNFLTYGYTHDQAGNRKTKTGTVNETYDYDSVYRLRQTTASNRTEAFTYDPVGNRLTGPGPKDAGYQYDAANRMTMGKLYGHDYDNYGNQLTRTVPNVADKGWALFWDYENRLVKMEQSKGTTEKRTVTFKYDPLGRRIEKKLVSTSNGTTKTSTYTYVYDGDGIALEVLVDGAGAPVKTFYTQGSGVDEHLALERGVSYYFYHADGLGSVTAITNQSKSVVQSYAYDSFGMLKAVNNTFSNSYTYTGREWDKETGLYYYRARYYDPMDGRFINKDPIGFNGGDVDLYGYVNNNPVNSIDPYGLFKLFGKEINFNIGSGLQGGIQAFILGLNGSVGGIIGTDGQKCGVITICGRIGPGIYAGGGAYGSVGGTQGSTSNVEGWSVGGGLDAGWGASTGGQAVIGLKSTGGSGPIPKAKAGGGFGANAGVDVCYTFTLLCSCPSK